MARFHNQTELTPDVLRGIAADLTGYASEYQDLAEKLDRLGGRLTVENYKSMVQGLDRIERHLAKTFTAYQSARRTARESDGVPRLAAEPQESYDVKADAQPRAKKRPAET